MSEQQTEAQARTLRALAVRQELYKLQLLGADISRRDSTDNLATLLERLLRIDIMDVPIPVERWTDLDPNERQAKALERIAAAAEEVATEVCWNERQRRAEWHMVRPPPAPKPQP